MGSAAKKLPPEKTGSHNPASPAESLRKELLDVAKKAAGKAAKIDEAIFHYLGAFILDVNVSLMQTESTEEAPTVSMVNATPKFDRAVVTHIQELATKAYGADQKKLWITFADVHHEMNELITPITKPLDLKTCLQHLRDAMTSGR